jgi:hypothetical protein
LRTIYARHSRLTEEARALESTRAFLDEVEADYLAGHLSLDEASERVIEHAREFRPRYLIMVDALEPGSTLRVKVARRLARRFTGQFQDDYHIQTSHVDRNSGS